MPLRSCLVQQFPVIGSHCWFALQLACAAGALTKGMANADPPTMAANNIADSLYLVMPKALLRMSQIPTIS